VCQKESEGSVRKRVRERDGRERKSEEREGHKM
jgi:hypothetical protein